MIGVVLGFAFLFGAVFGSFGTVVAYRVPRGESIVRPRSRCPGCGEQIREVDNIPIVSWIVRRGRCRSCSARISVRYPLTELASGLLFVLAAYVFRSSAYLAVVMALFFWVLLVLSLIDLEHHKIPNKITYPAIPAFALAVVGGWLLGVGMSPVSALIGLAAYGGGLLVIALIVPAGMGIGDVKLCALIGLVLGSLGLPYVAVAAAAGILVGGISGVLTLLVSGGTGKSVIPFGPALAIGAVVSAVFAPPVWAWYAALLTGASA